MRFPTDHSEYVARAAARTVELLASVPVRPEYLTRPETHTAVTALILAEIAKSLHGAGYSDGPHTLAHLGRQLGD